MPVHLEASVPRAVAVTPVRPPGCDRQDVLRNARAFLREVHPVGAVHLPFHGLDQDVTPVRVPGSGHLRNSALVGIPVRPQVQLDIFVGASPSRHFQGCKSKLTFSRVQVKVDIFAGATGIPGMT